MIITTAAMFPRFCLVLGLLVACPVIQQSLFAAEPQQEAKPEGKSWALKEYTTLEARIKTAQDAAFQDSLGGQAELAEGIAKMSVEQLGQSAYKNTFPFFEYDLPTGTYTVRLEYTDAAYHNAFYVGVPKKLGGHYPHKQELEVVYGVLDNRDSSKPIQFTLKVRTTIRFAAWADRHSIGWRRSFMREKWDGDEITYAIEDSDRPEHLDFNDLVIVFERWSAQ